VVRRPERPRRGRKPISTAHVRPRLPAVRQRQRLIDACISALHIYGPSETTVQKVVRIARLSPGIVRFYFKSKSAMLVESLRHLATEFEQLVVEPVSRLKDRPTEALEKLVELYVDPSVSSPRKVSVWYAFWGEATARQEYLDICGEKDERFAALVRELIERLVMETGRSHLDSDAIALGLIGALEIIWQGIAFQDEANVDRAKAHARCLAYLASVFPGSFAPPSGLREAASFDHAWQLVGRLPPQARTGDYRSIDLHGDRAIVVRGPDSVGAYRNTCPVSPHALVMARNGQFGDCIDCAAHRLRFDWDGRAADAASAMRLESLEQFEDNGFIFVRAAPGSARDRGEFGAWLGTPSRDFAADDAFREIDVAAHWQVLIEQLLLHRMPDSAPASPADPDSVRIAIDSVRRQITWQARSSEFSGWSAKRLATLLATRTEAEWKRRYCWPNLLLELRPDGAGALQVIPTGRATCRLQCFDFPYAARESIERNIRFLVSRLERRAVSFEVDLAASTQQGMRTVRGQTRAREPANAALRAFRQFGVK
jgi:TetR/AcrR family transcriptional regulator, transcriptional repressor of bet genes